MNHYPILFNGPMVRAILAGTKTQTRRPMTRGACPYRAGTTLWVKETFGNARDVVGPPFYRADYTPETEPIKRWRPSIHMPRHYARLWLPIISAHTERLQEISEKDAKAEGIQPRPECKGSHTYAFAYLWNAIYGPGSWKKNPMVTVVSFQVIRREIQ